NTPVDSLALCENAVGLHSQRVEEQHVSSPLIVKRIKPNCNVVVAGEIVTLCHCRPHLFAVIERVNAEIEKFCVVANTHFGWLRSGGVVARLSLEKVVTDGRILPNDVIEVTVDDGLLREASHIQGGSLAGAGIFAHRGGASSTIRRLRTGSSAKKYRQT